MLIMGLTIISANGLTLVLKAHYARVRPRVVSHLVAEDSWSFPSGHSLMSAVIYLLLGVLVARSLKHPRQRLAVIAAAFLLSFLIGLSRVYLGVHYPTDVLAGWSGGTALAILGSAVLLWCERPAGNRLS